MLELTADNFKENIDKDKAIIVDFWAAWCGPCRMMGPVFEELSKEYKDLTFAKLDTEAHGQIAAASNVRGIPCLIVFKKGKEVDRIVGFAPKPALKAKIDAALAKAK
ncbi:MAG: thioredoxin [Nanoarchaeota archaeon]